MADSLLDKREERVRRMFDNIAPYYDLLNHLLSCNVDQHWRRRVTRLVPPAGPAPILDLCTGTGDLALAYDRAAGGKTPIIGADFARAMLVRAAAKIQRRGAGQRIRLVEADAQSLPFPDDHFQIVTVAFGLRNVTDTDRCLAEMVRVARPGGKVAILEFSKPKGSIFGKLYRCYFRYLLPLVGQIISRSKDKAYSYLPASVLEFPDGATLAQRLEKHGLSDVSWHPFTFGIATLYVGTKGSACGLAHAPRETSAKPQAAPLLLRAARGEATERPPVWAMRQAGRWDPEFNRLRSGLAFYEFSENVELAIKTSLLPRRFGVDAIILFYDITTLTVAMGLPFKLQPGRGPVPDRPIRTMQDVERLAADPEPKTFGHVLDMLKGVKAELRSELPVLVFAGAPFTVASYCIDAGKELETTRKFAQQEPAVWRGLLDRIGTATASFLRTLIAAGADAYQLFDSWAGMLSRAEYETWAQPYHRSILAAAGGVPRILFVKEGPYLDLMAASGAEVVSLGRCHDLAAARRTYPDLVLQGNVDQEVLLHGSVAQVIEATQRCLSEGGGRRHIVNLNHGVDRNTPPENFQAFVQTVTNAVCGLSARGS